MTPADSHLALASEALRAGKACFVEKPLALTAAEGRELAGVVTATGGLLQVGHVFRFHPVTDALRRYLDAGALGRVRYATARFAGFKRPRSDSGVTRADAIHAYDLLAYLLRAAPTAVTATLRDHLSRGLDDCSFSTVEYGPVAAFVEAGYFAPPTSRACVIVGADATIAADFAAAEVRLHRSRHVPGATGWEACVGPVEVIAAEGPEPLERELERFLDAATRGLASPVGVEAGVLALQVVEAVELSSRLGRRVGLDEVDRVDGSARHLSPAGLAPSSPARSGSRAAAAAARLARRARFSAARMSLGEIPAESLGQDSTGPASPSSTRERRLAHVLLALWCAFILYGSFIPFQLALGHEGLWDRMSRVQLLPFRDGRRAFSILDVASNVLLFVPFGALTTLGFSPGHRRPRILPIAAAALLAGLLAMLIELGQLFAAGRTASLIDLAANMTGAILGAAAMALVWRSGEGRLAAAATALVRREPLVVPIALLAVTFLAEATYPFSITLDVSTLWGNLKAIAWAPFAVPRFWGELVVDRGLRYALLGGMLAVVVDRHLSRIPARTAAAGLVAAFAIGVELVKLLFEGRAPKVENAAVAIAGGLVGIAVLPAAARWDPVRRHPAAALGGLAILLLVHVELAPFEFGFDPATIRARLPRIEWLPFQSYYGADFQSALFDLWGKVSISGLLGFAVALGTGRGPLASALVGLAAGSGLEALQIATVSRHPSVSDVLAIALGAALGGAVYRRYRALTERDHEGNPGHAPPGNRARQGQEQCDAGSGVA